MEASREMMAVTDEHTPVSSSYLKRIPQFWANSLFPEKSAATDSTSIRWRHLLLLIFLPALLLYPTRNFLLLEPDEGRYAEIAREMMVSGSWVVPTLQGEPYLDKPPLFYWLVKISFQLFGVSDATARLVPALAVHLTILALYLIGRRSLGERLRFIFSTHFVHFARVYGDGSPVNPRWRTDFNCHTRITLSLRGHPDSETSPRLVVRRGPGKWTGNPYQRTNRVDASHPAADCSPLVDGTSAESQCHALTGLRGRACGHQSALVLGHLPKAAGVFEVLFLGSQRDAVPAAVRSPAAGMVLRPRLFLECTTLLIPRSIFHALAVE